MRKRLSLNPRSAQRAPFKDSTADQLWILFTVAQLDLAVDLAARSSHSNVAMFAASPLDVWVGGASVPTTGIEFAIEFFVPPLRRDDFVGALDEQLGRLSADYAIGRQQGRFAAPQIRTVPAGTFHQWRFARRCDEVVQSGQRWSRDRRIVNSVLEQARVDWQELTT